MKQLKIELRDMITDNIVGIYNINKIAWNNEGEIRYITVDFGNDMMMFYNSKTGLYENPYGNITGKIIDHDNCTEEK